MKLETHIAILLLTLVMAAQGCRFTNGARNDRPSAADPARVAVDVTTVQWGEFADVLEVVGSLSPKYEAHVKSEYQGIIDQVYVTEWVRVKKGDQP